MSEDNRSNEIDISAVPLVIAEYTSLRNEVLKLVELEHQLASGALLAVGVFLTVGLQPNKPASILLVYPMLATFLAAGWAHKDMRIRQITKYIRTLENKIVNEKPITLGWAHFLQSERENSGFRRILGLLSASGIFLVTQIFTVGLACSIGISTSVDRVLLLWSVLCILGTFIILKGSIGWRKSTPD